MAMTDLLKCASDVSVVFPQKFDEIGKSGERLFQNFNIMMVGF